MQLSTGLVTPITVGTEKKYGIDNLKLILRSAVNLGKIIATVRKNPPPKGAWAKLKNFFITMFANRSTFAEIGQDFAQLAANADLIKKELANLDAEELEELIETLGIADKVSTPARFINNLPTLLDAIKSLADLVD